MKIINGLFLSIFSGMIFFSILLLPILSQMNILSMILLTFIFLPLLLAGFWQGLTSYIPIVIALVVIAFMNFNLSIIVTIIFVIPVFLLSLIQSKYKDISYGYILSIISSYNVVVCVGILIYFGFFGNTSSIHNVIHDTITFMSILANQYMGDDFKKISNLEEQIDILSFVLPTIISVLSIMWLFFNYVFATKIALKSSILKETENSNNYNLPTIYTIIFMILIALSLLAHKVLDKNQNLYYICYNVLFILSFGYFYSGFCFLWSKVKSKNNLLINIVYTIFVVVLFVEFVIIFSIIGFIIEIKRIVFKK